MAAATTKQSRSRTKPRVRPAGRGWRLIDNDMDGVLLGTVIALLVIGILMMFSASYPAAIEDGLSGTYYATRQLIFAGAGPLENELKALSVAQKLPHAPMFRFFSREQLVRVICASDLYVHPAEVEIEAISCLEAISCGLVPVISDSPRSATRFFALDEKNLFKCNDSQDLADKIDYWLEHPEEKTARYRDYLGFTKQFDYDECMDRMEQMIIETNARVRRQMRDGADEDAGVL